MYTPAQELCDASTGSGFSAVQPASQNATASYFITRSSPAWMREATDLQGFMEVSAAQISRDILIIQTEAYRNAVMKPQINVIALLFCNKPFKMFVKQKQNKKTLKRYGDIDDVRAFISQ